MDRKVIVSNLKAGDRLSRLSYLKVLAVYGGSVRVENEQGVRWDIGNDIVENECYSANQYYGDIKYVTRTELIDIFNSVGDAVYTVNFNKQPKLSDAFDSVCNKGKIKSNATLKKELSKAMEGEERTLVGYTISRETQMGRSMVIDLQTEDINCIRQVDHRTLNWLICKNVKYAVK